jgi:hypothetical protein
MFCWLGWGHQKLNASISVTAGSARFLRPQN